MRLGKIRRSDNVSQSKGRGPMIAGGGLGTIVLIGLVFLMGGDLGDVFNVVMQNQANVQPQAPVENEDEQVEFVSKVLALTEDVWAKQFQQNGMSYEDASLEIFRGLTQTACGHGQAAMGPFYCPADETVYIDLTFYDTLRTQLGAPGDFAQAYVIAHEVGHHIQNQLGYSDRVHRARQTQSEQEANRMSVRLELQADYLAGVWAHHAETDFQILEQGDVEEGLTAAQQIGDDMLQKKSQGHIVPENFTHGTSAQRVRWFRAGLESGDFSQSALDRFFDLDYSQL
ncbi:MAG: neutral zinc metallopeptidase [Rubinisphaera brasiliensis]|uniref:KPN_02809 family neutral zinc metallopeptidase n=1 Tax=Rubinisphaera brasiliensis TaxID=119 RepID=UPI00391DA230